MTITCFQVPAVLNNEIMFAVKSCHKFHKERIPIVKNTWGEVANNIKYFSDMEGMFHNFHHSPFLSFML